MINWFDMPAEGLSNGGLFEVKELEVTENGTYETKGEMYNKVTVNVEGGGGSSDFSTAQVTIVNNYSSEFIIEMAVAMSEEGMDASLGTLTAGRIDTGMVANVILYKGSAGAIIDSFPLDAPPTIVTSGNIQNMEDNAYLITGDCTITIS